MPLRGRLKPEAEIQVRIVAVLRLSGYMVFHPKNEGRPDGKDQRLGLLPGVSDLVILSPAGGKHGAVLELKAPGKRPTAKQRAFLQAAEANGYHAGWADSYEDALGMLRSWGYEIRDLPAL